MTMVDMSHLQISKRRFFFKLAMVEKSYQQEVIFEHGLYNAH